MGNPALLSAREQERPVKRGEQPALHLGEIAELMSFGGPEVEGLLREIAGVGLRSREAQGKPEEGRVLFGHNLLKLLGWIVHCSGSPKSLKIKGAIHLTASGLAQWDLGASRVGL